MAMEIRLSRIYLFPIKSLDGVLVPSARITEGGALQNDRTYAMVDDGGRALSGKREEKIFQLRATYSEDLSSVELLGQDNGQRGRFHMEEDRTSLEEFLSDYFGKVVRLQKNEKNGFPDDTEASGPTLVTTATIRSVAAWFPGIDEHEMELRLRTNLILDAEEPFFEDRLYSDRGKAIDFQLGRVRFFGINPCRRCTVPSRNPRTGETYPDFRKVFEEKRRETLPSFANRERFDIYYRLTLNTRVAKESYGTSIAMDDTLAITGEIAEQNV